MRAILERVQVLLPEFDITETPIDWGHSEYQAVHRPSGTIITLPLSLVSEGSLYDITSYIGCRYSTLNLL